MTYRSGFGLARLGDLREDWDTYGGKPITQEAIKTAEAIWFVPCADGGVQIELHAGGADIEVEINPDGSVNSVYWAKGE